MKTFIDEITKFYNKLINGENFALVRFGDGEWSAINSKKNTNYGNNEWKIDLLDKRYLNSVELLKESILYKSKDYYIGIPCVCCQQENHYTIKNFIDNEANLTFANIFINSNYKFFTEHYINFFKKSKIILVANKITNIENLPFNVEKFYPIEYDAWVENFDLIEKIKIDIENISGAIFLFSCGSFSKILCYELWKFNNKNTYLDVGSTLDPWTKANLLTGKYYENDYYINLTCIWN